MNLITASRLAAARACPRLHHIQYAMGIRPVAVDDNLRFGTLIHLALEAWWKASPDDRLLAATLALDTAEADEVSRVRARVLVAGYHFRWEREPYEPVMIDGSPAVEVQFEADLVNPTTGAASRTWRLAGKLDVIARNTRDGEVYVIEHKCLAGSSLIFDHSTGLYERADSLCASGRRIKLSALGEDGRLVIVEAKPVAPAGVRQIYRIETLGGRTLRVSGNHPIWTQRGWVLAENLDSDWVATPRSMASGVPDADITDEALRLIGYMIGDGSCSTKGMTFTKSDPAILADVVRCAATLGEDVEIKHPVKRAAYIKFSQAHKVGWRGCVEPAPVFAVIQRAHLLDVKSAGKRMPLHLGLSDRQLGQLLGALWSTDGCIDAYDGKLRIIYTSISRELCSDIQTALQRLGVVTNVRSTSVTYRGERRPVSTVQVVSRVAKRRFLALASDGVIPVLRSRVPLAEAVTLIPMSLQGADSRMQPRIDEMIWWDRVERVEHEPEEDTYDLEVPGLHTFVVDGIVTHNTSASDISPGSRYWEKLCMDSQLSIYFDGARALGCPPKAVIYDVIAKPGLRPLKATPEENRKYTKDGRLYATQRAQDETLEEYQARLTEHVASHPDEIFRRGEVVRLERELDEARHDVWSTAKRIREDDLAERWPRNPDACQRYGGMCAFFPACSGSGSLEDASLYRKIATAHPELSEAAA